MTWHYSPVVQGSCFALAAAPELLSGPGSVGVGVDGSASEEREELADFSRCSMGKKHIISILFFR